MQYYVTKKMGLAKSMQCLRSRGRLNNLIGIYISVSVRQGQQVTKHERFYIMPHEFQRRRMGPCNAARVYFFLCLLA